MTIDQTESERQLHRVLYVIKLLRATVLHVGLAALGAILYFVAGIENAYPMATAFIQAARAQAIDQHLNERTSLAWGYALAVLLIFAAALVLLVWIYRALTSVNRRALRVQAIVMLVLAAIALRAGTANMAFAFRELTPAFVILAVASVAMTAVVVPVNVAIALLRVSRLEERSSFVATLDSRLAPTWLAYLAKLLDLPRTPLRTPRTLGAFALAFAGALLMIASLMYLVGVGGASNTLATLEIIARHDLLEDAVRVASSEALRIWLLLPCALVGVKVAALLQSLAKRLGGLSLSDVIKTPDDRFVLYLRPFDLDQVILPRPRLSLGNRFFSFRPYPVRIEEELFDVADGYLPLIAIGKPGTAGGARGGLAYRTFLDDSDWQAFATERIRRAYRIVLVVEESPGVRWEIDRILADGAVDKTLFFFQPSVGRSAGSTLAETMMLDALRRSGAVAQSFEFASKPIGFYFHTGQLVEIVNENWSATSYRTAFSHFLAESAARRPQPAGAF